MNDNQRNWRVVGASVAGTSHLKSGLPCQDAFRYELLLSGVLVMALSDGAGSAAKAADGSTLAVEVAVSFLKEEITAGEPSTEEVFLGHDMVQKAFAAARTALVQQASRSNRPLRDYAATLMVLILAKDCTIGGLIGDCAAVMLDEAGQLTSLCRPQTGEYANMTHFLTQPDALQQLDVQIRAYRAQAVAVFSDGLSNLALNLVQNKPYAPFFTPLFAFTAAIENEQAAQTQLRTFLGSERINARTNDDKTLVLASRVG